MTYSVWLEPATKDAEYISKIIKRLGKKYDAPLFAPHITVHGNIRKYSLALKAANACADLSKIRVSCVKIRHTTYLWKTLYVEIKNNKRLQLINRTLGSTLANRYKFAPHISLIYKKLDTKTKKQIIEDLKIKRTFLFDRITIVRSSKNVSKWKKMKTIRLKN
ncbi:MAG TPA: hypothetical protein VNK44_00330 [Candidatus Nitrosotenuis sp.]|nr:hypothetical protein [Candidatus Nitrosotenuis sp.]